VLSQWNVTARLTAASGDKCIAEAVQSLNGAPKPYAIIVTQTANGGHVMNGVNVTVTGTSGDYDCTFTGATADSGGFTTFGTNGMYTCRTDFGINGFRCSDGTEANLITLGQDISASISGNEISGRWEIDWVDQVRSNVSLTTTTDFSGHRQ
jgi:hypothetical protein